MKAIHPKSKKKWSDEDLKAWMDWSIPKSPQSSTWHQTPEGQSGLRRYLLAQMVLLAGKDDLRESLKQAQKAQVDLSLVAEQALILEKRDLFFSLAKYLRIDWSSWPRAQMKERLALRERIKDTNLNFSDEIDNLYRHPTMLHLMIAKNPSWVSSAIRHGWSPEVPFVVSDSSLKGDYAICRAWLDGHLDLVEELWAIPEVNQSQDNKDALLSVLAMSSKNTTSLYPSRNHWIEKLLESGADINRANHVRASMPPPGMFLLHQAIFKPSESSHFLYTQGGIRAIQPESWEPSEFIGTMLPFLIQHLSHNNSNNSVFEELMQIALKIPTPSPQFLNEKITESILGGHAEVGTWYLEHGYRLPFDCVLDAVKNKWDNRKALRISLSEPFDEYQPGVVFAGVPWSLIGSFMSEKDELKWNQFGDDLRKAEPVLGDARYRVSREQTVVWHNKVSLMLALSPDIERSLSTPHRL